jgi:hypothetical protein
MAHFIQQPLTGLFQPVCEDFIAPFYNMGKDLYGPIYILMRGKNGTRDIHKAEAIQNWEKLLQATVRICMTFAVFLIYQKSWKAGVRIGGLLGGLGTFCVTYYAGYYIDPKSNYTGYSSWFLYKGVIGMLKSFGASPAAMLFLLLIRDRKFDQNELSFLNQRALKQGLHSAASFLAEKTFKEPAAVPPPLVQPPQ